MSKVRINDLAREMEVKSRRILDVLAELGLDAGKTHSSLLEDDEAEKVRARFGHGARRGSYAASQSRRPQGIVPMIDLSHVSKPGDVMKAILSKKREEEEEARERHKPQPPSRSPAPSQPTLAAPAEKKPRIFVSYSWDDKLHCTWVRHFAERLVDFGLDVRLDQWHAQYGDDLSQFMEQEVSKADFIVTVCTPKFAQKANERIGGAGYEQQIITADVVTGRLKGRVIPVWRSGDLAAALPTYLKGTKAIDLCDDARLEDAAEDLARRALNRPRYAPPTPASIHELLTQTRTPLPNAPTQLVSELTWIDPKEPKSEGHQILAQSPPSHPVFPTEGEDGSHHDLVRYIMCGHDQLLAYKSTREGLTGTRFLVVRQRPDQDPQSVSAPDREMANAKWTEWYREWKRKGFGGASGNFDGDPPF
jgi:hypothetical protein